MTAERQRLAYARICVEVDKNSSFPSSIDITDHDGRTYTQLIEYEWIPISCELCKQFGHRQTQCSKSTKQEWRPKPKPINDSTLNQGNEEVPNSAATPANSRKSPLPTQGHSKSAPSNALVISNKYELLDEPSEKALSITPLATDCSMAAINNHSSGLDSSTNTKSSMLIEEAPAKELIPANSPKDSTLEFDQPLKSNDKGMEPILSKSQRKKLSKIQHAEAQGSKASKAKSQKLFSSPP